MIRAWLIDDEALALKRLSRMLEATGRVSVRRVHGSGEALAQVNENAPDAIFLDIEMPAVMVLNFCAGWKRVRLWSL